MPTAYRPTRLEDLDAVDALVVSSINDLTERHGFGPMASRSPPRFQTLCLEEDPRGLWTAEEDGAPVGFAWSWACDDFWFLAQLFVKPGLQSSGIGRQLLARTFAHADAIGARNRALITFAFNTVSQGLYIQHGLLPRFPIYLMRIARTRLTERTRGPTLDVTTLTGSDDEIAALSAVDHAALGFSRAKHHCLLLDDSSLRGFGLHKNGRLIGYAYISQTGHIGPLAVSSPELTSMAFETALAIAAQGDSENVSCFIPGLNGALLQSAALQGLRIMFPMLAMSTNDLGTWPCYMPRNPGFM